MKYGLSLLVCFAMSVCANAQTVCTGGTCPIATKVAKVATAPVTVVRGVIASCGQNVTKTGPIRQFVRKVFRR